MSNTTPAQLPPLFNNFLVLGIDKSDLESLCLGPETNHLPGRLLYQYPPQGGLQPAPDFAFPQGVPIKRIKIRNSFSQLNELIYHNQKKIESQCFVFSLKGADDQMPPGLLTDINPANDQYLMCVTTKDYLEMTPQQFDFKDRKRRRERIFYKVDKVYCLVTQYPVFWLAFQVLLDMLNQLKITRLDQLHLHHDDDHQVLFHLDSHHTDQNMNSLLPFLQQAILTSPPTLQHCLSIPLQYQKVPELPLSSFCKDRFYSWAGPILFTSIPWEDLLQLWSALLLNKQVVLFSQDKAILTGCVLALAHLLTPFRWEFPLVPCLPQSLFSMMEAPLPFLFGLHSNQASLDTSLFTKAYFYSLDTHSLICTPLKRARLNVQMPILTHLLTQLHSLYLQPTPPLYSCTPSSPSAHQIHKAFLIFQSHLNDLLTTMLPHPTGSLDQVIKYVDNQSIHQSDGVFLRKLVRSQLMGQYIQQC